MKLTVTKIKINDRLTVLTSDNKVEEGMVVLDPIHRVNRVVKIYSDGSVKLKDECASYARSVQKIETVIIDGININLRD